MNTIIYSDVPVLIMKEVFIMLGIISYNIHTFNMCKIDIMHVNQVCKFIEIELKKVKQPIGNT